VVIAAVEPAYMEVNGLHGLHYGIYTPIGVDLTETRCMAGGEEQRKNLRDPIEHRSLHDSCNNNTSSAT